jgi:glycosyltransferase involved in cell wall biosynthesis
VKLRKVIHVIENLDATYGGPARSVPNLANEMFKYGLDVELMSLAWKEQEDNDVIQKNNLLWLRHKLFGPKKMGLSLSLFHTLKQHCANGGVIIHLHNLWNGVSLVCYILAKKYNIPLVISPRGSLYPWSLSQGRLRKLTSWGLFQKKAMNRANFIHVTDQSELDSVRALGINSPILLVPNGVEQMNKPTVRKWLQVRRSRDDDTAKKYLFLSRVHRKKGVDLLLMAWAKSVAREKGSILNIAGEFSDERYKKKILGTLRDLKLQDSVKFLGMLRGDRKEQEFLNADLFILPSHSENFGNAVAEALARGLPVITTTGTPWRRIVETNCGWWIDLTVANLTNAIDESSSLPRQQLMEMGIRAHELSNFYGWNAQGLKLIEGYSDYCGEILMERMS